MAVKNFQIQYKTMANGRKWLPYGKTTLYMIWVPGLSLVSKRYMEQYFLYNLKWFIKLDLIRIYMPNNGKVCDYLKLLKIWKVRTETHDFEPNTLMLEKLN